MDAAWDWIAANPYIAIGIVLGLAVLGGIALDGRRRQTKVEQEETAEQMEQRVEEREERLTRRKRDLALSCDKCDKLAEPIEGTGNRYRCEHCSNQFAGAHHGL